MPKRTNNGMEAIAPDSEEGAIRMIRQIDTGRGYGPEYEQHGGRSRHGVEGGPGSKNRGPKSSDERY